MRPGPSSQLRQVRLVILLLAPIWASCGSDKRTLTTPTAPTASSPSGNVLNLSITGKATLTSVLETSQLTATAMLSDGSTKDATAEAKWTSTDTNVVSFSTGGLITARGLGATLVSVQYGNRYAYQAVTVTPAGTFAFYGNVREPGFGHLANVRVVESASGRSATTNGVGVFTMAEIPRLPARLRIEKEGYETAEVDVTGTNVDFPIQKIVRLVAGDTVTPNGLAPQDLSYALGNTRCDDCRLIRISVPRAGTVHLRFTWTRIATLDLFAEGLRVAGDQPELNADIPVSAPRELIVYFGALPPNSVTAHTPFTLETSMR